MKWNSLIVTKGKTLTVSGLLIFLELNKHNMIEQENKDRTRKQRQDKNESNTLHKNNKLYI